MIMDFVNYVEIFDAQLELMEQEADAYAKAMCPGQAHEQRLLRGAYIVGAIKGYGRGRKVGE